MKRFHEILERVRKHPLFGDSVSLRFLEEISMAVADELAAINANLVQIGTGIANLDAQIQTFLSAAGSSTLSAADQAALDAIQASSAALAATANAVVAAPTVVAPPPVVPAP